MARLEGAGMRNRVRRWSPAKRRSLCSRRLAPPVNGRDYPRHGQNDVLFVRMPSPPFGAGVVQIPLVDTLARRDLLPQIPPDALKLIVRHGLPVARGAARFLRPFNRGLAHGCEEINGTAVLHGSIVAESFARMPPSHTGKAASVPADRVGTEDDLRNQNWQR